MPLKAGTIADYNNSMAQDIENAFRQEWPNVMGNTPLPEDNKQMKLMFIAISQGVVRHLVNNPDAFKVAVDEVSNHSHQVNVNGLVNSTNNGGHDHGTEVNIEFKNTLYG